MDLSAEFELRLVNCVLVCVSNGEVIVSVFRGRIACLICDLFAIMECNLCTG